MTETPEQPTNAEIMAVLQALASNQTIGLANLNSKIEAVRDELRGEIRATEANLVARINSVQEVVRSVKADISAHVDDPTAHHRHAA